MRRISKFKVGDIVTVVKAPEGTNPYRNYYGIYFGEDYEVLEIIEDDSVVVDTGHRGIYYDGTAIEEMYLTLKDGYTQSVEIEF